MRLYTVYNYIIRYETNIIMIKYNNLLSFNKIYTIQLNTIVKSGLYRGAFSKRPLKGNIQWTTTKSKSLTAWDPVEQRLDVKVIIKIYTQGKVP